MLAYRGRAVTLHLEAAFPSAPSAPINDRNGASTHKHPVAPSGSQVQHCVYEAASGVLNH